MRKEIPAEARRQVSHATKIAIVAVLCVAAVFLVWFKLPFEKTYTATLVQCRSGESDAYGDLIEVTVSARVQRYFFASPTHGGTVSVGAEAFSTPQGKTVPVWSLLGAAERSDSFSLTCSEWRGDYLVTRAVAYVEHGVITGVTLFDANGVYAGQYGRLPKNAR